MHLPKLKCQRLAICRIYPLSSALSIIQSVEHWSNQPISIVLLLDRILSQTKAHPLNPSTVPGTPLLPPLLQLRRPVVDRRRQEGLGRRGRRLDRSRRVRIDSRLLTLPCTPVSCSTLSSRHISPQPVKRCKSPGSLQN